MLFDQLERLVQSLLRHNIRGELWINGSFMTRKPDPNDIDVCFLYDMDFYYEANAVQFEVIEWLARGNLKGRYGVDCHVVARYPRQHPMFYTGEMEYALYLRLFGQSRQEVHKGIAVLEI